MKRLFFLLLFIPLVSYSQTRTISGNVKDETGSPLPGVSIQVKNSKKTGASSDFDGNFKITLPTIDSNILIFTYIGYATKEINIKNLNTINVQLEPSATQLDEIVVIGYGSVLKKDITGSVSAVKIEKEISNQLETVDQLLQGRVAGVQVIQNAGVPGLGISVKIRGANSLRGNNEPLYVVDGIIISSAGEDVTGGAGLGNSGQEEQNGLTGINPNDIEDIQILKDASATAIYGSRGANGVVLITTKKGNTEKAVIKAFVNSSVSIIDKKIDVLDAVGYAQYVNEFRGNSGNTPAYEIIGDQVFPVNSNTGIASSVAQNKVDWQDLIFKETFQRRVGVNASSGNDNGNYFISAVINNQQGLVDNSYLKSGNFRLNLNQTLTKRLKLETTISALLNEISFGESGDRLGNNGSFIRNIIGNRPLTRDLDDTDDDNNVEFITDLAPGGPTAWITDFSDLTKEKRYMGSLGLIYDIPVKGLKYEIKFGGDIRNKDRRRFYGLTTFQGRAANGALQLQTLNTQSYQINNFLRYNRTLKRKHRINSLIGVTYDVRKVDRSVYAVQNFITTQFTTEQPFYGQSVTQPLIFFNADQQIFSILGRLNYTYNDKYILTASFRRDGVSKFAKENKYGFFPSFALAWKIKNENFLKNNSFINDLKLRAGWGQIGNHGIQPFGTLSDYGISPNGELYGDTSNGTVVPFFINNVANPTLTWETTEQVNLGIDFSLLNEKITGTVDAYNKTTKDLLIQRNLPLSSGFGTILVNNGDISNKGLEVSLNYTPISTKDFEISFGGNIAFNKTKIERLGYSPSSLYIDGVEEQKIFTLGSEISRGGLFHHPANIFVVGEESALFYGYKTDGIYQSTDTNFPSTFGRIPVPGDVKIVDLTNDGIVDDKDRTFLGNPNPDFIYGFNFNLKYKGFSMSTLFSGVFGNDIANGNLLFTEYAVGSSLNISPNAYYNAWRPTAETNTYPRIGYNAIGNGLTDRIIEDGSFLRLNNVTLKYDVPVKDTKFISNLSIHVTGQNLYTWTKYSGFNPEITSFQYDGLIQGVDWNSSPNAKTFLLGLNVTF